MHDKEELLKYKEFLLDHISKSNNLDHMNWVKNQEISKLDSVRTFPANFELAFYENKLTGVTRTKKVIASSLKDLLVLLLIKNL